MIVKLNGGSTDIHMISLNDMRKLSDSIQKISYNYELQKYGTKNQNIYIQANKEGSFEILLGLIDPSYLAGLLVGVQGNFLFELIKKMREYLDSDTKKEDIKKLVDETFQLALELAEAEYFDVRFEKKKQTIEKNTKLINAELANYQAMKQIASIVGKTDEEQSLKPTSIIFTSEIEDAIELLEINNSTKELLSKNELDAIKIENIIISGVPDGLTRASMSFMMEVAFIGKLKVHATNKQLNEVSDYFKSSKSIKIEVEPIIKMGDLIETRDAKLIKIIKD
jgi:ribosomal protein L29